LFCDAEKSQTVYESFEGTLYIGRGNVFCDGGFYANKIYEGTSSLSDIYLKKNSLDITNIDSHIIKFNRF
jgi:hypothetical protein